MRKDYALQPGTTSGKEVHTHMCSAHTHMCIAYVYTSVCSYVYRYVIICAYKGVCLLHVYVFSLLTLHISVRFNHPGGKIIWGKNFSSPEHIDLFPCLYYLNSRAAAPTEYYLPHLNSGKMAESKVPNLLPCMASQDCIFLFKVHPQPQKWVDQKVKLKINWKDHTHKHFIIFQVSWQFSVESPCSHKHGLITPGLRRIRGCDRL